MKLSALSLSAIAGFSCVGAAPQSTSNMLFDSTPRSVQKDPHTFIVEFDEHQVAEAKRDGTSAHNIFHEHMKRSLATDVLGGLDRVGKKYKTKFSWDQEKVFTGLSLHLDHPADVALLRAAPGVRSVWQSQRYSRTAQHDQIVVPSTDMVEALTKNAQKTTVKRDSSIPLNDTFAPHKMAGVDKLHVQGLFGENITVGVIDTGIDYTLATLNAGQPDGTPCYGKPDCQVIGGRDLVGDNYTDQSDPVPDDDPLDQCQGHGTHVAATIAARDDGRGFTGVAPLAKIKAYRVFGCAKDSFVSTDVLIEALLYAFNDGIDIISMSIGGASGWQEDPSSLVASRIAATGLPVFISAGNDGSAGTLYASGPASGQFVTAVASVDNTEIGGYTVSTVGQQGDPYNFVFLMANPWNETGTLPLKALSTDPSITNDGCNPDQVASAGDLTGYIVVIGRGGCLFASKIANVMAAGATHAIIYNTPSPDSINFPAAETPGFESAGIFRGDGIYLLQQLAAGAKIEIDLSNQVATAVVNKDTGGHASSFSSYGPTWELDISTQVAAPGGNILSSWPLPLGKYAILSGTSMACPFLAGSAALYRSAVKNGKSLGAVEQTAVFSSTATPLTVVGAPDVLESVAHVGGGLVDVYRAVTHTSEVSPAKLSLNDTRHFAGQQTFKIANIGDAPQTYQIRHTPSGTLTSINTTTGSWYGKPPPVSISPAPADVTFDKTTLTIPAGGSDQVTVTFVAPKGLDPRSIPIYSGFINAESDNEAGSVSVMYAGVADDLYTEPVLDRTATNSPVDAPLPALLDGSGALVDDDSHVFTLQSVNDTLDAPSIAVYHRLGFAHSSLDLVLANATNTAQIARRHRMLRLHKSSLLRRDDQHSSNSSFSALPIYGNVVDYRYEPRDTEPSFFSLSTDVYTDGGDMEQKPIEDGEYQLLYRVSKLFGDLSDGNDYEAFLSHKFTIKRST